MVQFRGGQQSNQGYGAKVRKLCVPRSDSLKKEQFRRYIIEVDRIIRDVQNHGENE